LRNTYSLWNHAKTFKEEALKIPGVVQATMTRDIPNAGINNTNGIFKDASLSATGVIIMQTNNIDADYVSTLGMEMAKGRNFSPLMPTDTFAVLVNETGAKMLGFSDPLNQTVYQPGDSLKPVAYHIVGVVK